jgi:hypothetical protein
MLDSLEIRLSTCAAIVAVAASAVAMLPVAGSAIPHTLSTGQNFVAQSLITQTNPDLIKGITHLVIGQFEVQFIDQSATSNIPNYQEIADTLFAKLQSELIAEGFTLHPLESLSSTKYPQGYSDLLSAAATVRPQLERGLGGQSAIYAPSGFPLLHSNESLISAQFNTRRGTLLAEIEDIYSAADSADVLTHKQGRSDHLGIAKLAKLLRYESNNVLLVRYVVTPGFGVAPNQTRFVLVNSHKSGNRLSLTKALAASNSEPLSPLPLSPLPLSPLPLSPLPLLEGVQTAFVAALVKATH